MYNSLWNLLNSLPGIEIDKLTMKIYIVEILHCHKTRLWRLLESEIEWLLRLKRKFFNVPSIFLIHEYSSFPYLTDAFPSFHVFDFNTDALRTRRPAERRCGEGGVRRARAVRAVQAVRAARVRRAARADRRSARAHAGARVEPRGTRRHTARAAAECVRGQTCGPQEVTNKMRLNLSYVCLFAAAYSLSSYHKALS